MKNLVLILFLFFIVKANAQVLKIDAKVELSHLNDDQQKDLLNLEEKIEEYYNNFDWVEDEYEYDVNGSVHVIIETVQQKAYERSYKAQFLISTESGENFYDKSWVFPYEANTPLDHSNPQFNPLTDLLNFYAFLVLGGELDDIDTFLGSPLYEHSLSLANRAMMSNYAQGWNTRLENLQKITNIRTRPLREIKPDFFAAVSLLADGEDGEAFKYAVKALKGINKTFNSQPNNYYLRIFLDAHYRDLSLLFSGQNEHLENLVTIDSKHRESYREQMN
jgi:hypothetical protein